MNPRPDTRCVSDVAMVTMRELGVDEVLPRIEMLLRLGNVTQIRWLSVEGREEGCFYSALLAIGEDIAVRMCKEGDTITQEIEFCTHKQIGHVDLYRPVGVSLRLPLHLTQWVKRDDVRGPLNVALFWDNDGRYVGFEYLPFNSK